MNENRFSLEIMGQSAEIENNGNRFDVWFNLLESFPIHFQVQNSIIEIKSFHKYNRINEIHESGVGWWIFKV